MIYYAPFLAEHLPRIQLQDEQCWVKDLFAGAPLDSLENDFSATVFRDKTPIACGGVVDFGDGRGFLWSYLGMNISPRDFIKVHAITRALVEQFPFRRLEAYVSCDFENGHRWMRSLGFDMECARMKSFQKNGADSALYAKVN